jgi:hypothetical protein
MDGTRRLEQLVLEGHVVLWLETNTGTEDVGEAGTLLGESVHDRSASRGERGLFLISTNRFEPVLNHIP